METRNREGRSIGARNIVHRLSATAAAQRIWLFAGIGAFLALAVVGTQGWFAWSVPTLWTAKGAFLMVLAAISVCDWRTRGIPAEVTVEILGVGMVFGLMRLARNDASALPFWMGTYVLWRTRLMGGGDAKLLMGVFGLWPDVALLRLIAALMLASGVLILVARYRLDAPRRLAQNGASFVAHRFALPAGAHEDAATWVYALAIALYVLFLI